MEPKTEIKHLFATSLDEFAAFCAEHQLPAYRAEQIYDWIYRKGIHDFQAMSNLSKSLRQILAEHWVIGSSKETRRVEAKDGTTKLLLEWPDLATSECVLIPDGDRRTACISSQVGCSISCRFCASGLAGLQRQLTAGQIVEQVMCLRAICEPAHRLSNIVFMGLGEPLANYKAVLSAIRIINAEWGINIGARKITVSTVGLPQQIRRLAREKIQINLAISLHAPTDQLRQQLIPLAKKVSIEQLTAAGRYFFETTGREVTVEYVLLGGVNDQPEHANQLVTVCRRMRCNVNIIRYNPVPGLDFERPTSFAAKRFLDRLRERGLNVHVRKSKGLDIDAACGQLRRSVAG